jgi:hypothetical protein
VSDTYRRHLEPYAQGRPVHVIPHGYSYTHARRIDEAVGTDAAPPRELASLPKPILGYVGSIHDSYVDVSRVERVSRAFPGASIVLIGPYRNNPLGADLSKESERRLRALPNVHLLGPRHFLEIPRYVKCFDVALVLVNVDDYSETARTNRRTHFKWLLYFSMARSSSAPSPSRPAAANQGSPMRASSRSTGR